MNFVYNEERHNIIQVGNEFLQKYGLNVQNEEKLKITCKTFTKADTNFHHKKFTAKVMHSYFNRTIEKDQKRDHKTSAKMDQKSKIDFHLKGSIAAIKGQEILINYLINKRATM